MATQTLPDIQAPLPRDPQCFQRSLTPPYHNDPKPDGPWLDQGGRRALNDNFSMSILPSRELLPKRNIRQTSLMRSYPPTRPPYRSPREASVNPPISLPPLRHLSRTPPTPSDRRYGSPFALHSILNPQAELIEQQRALRHSNSQMESPSPVDTQNSQSLPSISRPNSVDSTEFARKQQRHAKPFQPPERTPARPLYPEKGIRTHSLSQLNLPIGAIDARQSTFLIARTRPSEVMKAQPVLPTPPAGGWTYYLPPIAPTPTPNMTQTEIHQPSVSFPQSGSASTIPQHSPYSQPDSVALSQYDNHGTLGQYGPMRRHTPIHDSRQRPVSMGSERGGMIAMAPSNQSSVQLMTIRSQDGSLHNIQVETQTASKGADEKRRRNAGASARFRARRKEKERDASMNISRLEQNVRDSNEDAEYYRAERDYWRSIAMQAHPKRYITRPPSPRLRRVSVTPSRALSSTTGHSSEAYHDDYEGTREEERDFRRRTSSHHPAFGLHHTDASVSGHESHRYSTSTFVPVNYTPPQPHQYPQHQQTQSQSTTN